jgi:uncharacterized protein YunC (DUF1805 family)
MEKILVDDIEMQAGVMDIFGVNILLIKSGHGALGCGYINLAAAEKFGHALAIVSGVNDYDDMFNAEVRSISKAAAELGVSVGMSGFEALKLMN